MTVSNRSTRKQPPAIPATKRTISGWWLVFGCLGIIALFILSIAVFMFVFNIVSPIFGGPTIDWWQALAIWVLLSMVGSVLRGVVSKS